MEHQHLFFHTDPSEFETTYPNGKVEGVRPGVAGLIRPSLPAQVLFNKKKTNYEITVHHQDRSGTTVTADTTVLTPLVLEGKSVKVNLYPEEVDGYKCSHGVEKIEVTGDTAYTIVYSVFGPYTVTVHHTFEGSALTADTTVLTDPVIEGEFVSVTINPEVVEGYRASAVTIQVSGDTEYTLEYEEGIPIPTLVDLELPSGTLWAAWNLGASSSGEIGDYYAWGETEPKTFFGKENYAWYDTGTSAYTKYYTVPEGYEEGPILESTDDAITVAYGGDWHMPNMSQCQELYYNTTSAVTTIGGVSGVTFTSNVNGNSIFFPGAGVLSGNSQDINVGEQAFFDYSLCWVDGLAPGIEGSDPSGACFDIYQGRPEVYSVFSHLGMHVRGVVGNATEVVTEPEN